MNPFNYTLQEWIPGMVTTQTIIPPSQLSSIVLRFAYFGGALFGGLLIIFYLRDFLKKPIYKLLLSVMAFYSLVLLIYNYFSYVQLGQPVAITGRYLLPVMPIFILFVGLSVVKLVGQNRKVLVTLVIGSLLLFTQGGGITTYLLAAEPDQYWQGSVLRSPNTFFRNHLKPIIRLSKAN